MKRNIGSADRVIRLLAAALIAILVFTGALTGTVAVVSGIAAAILALTALVRICPLYLPFGLSTNKQAKTQ
jgi:hypothetical protein